MGMFSWLQSLLGTVRKAFSGCAVGEIGFDVEGFLGCRCTRQYGPQRQRDCEEVRLSIEIREEKYNGRRI